MIEYEQSIQFFSGTCGVAGGSAAGGGGRDAGLQGNRSVRDGDEPPFQSIGADYYGSRAGSQGSDADSVVI